MIQTLKEESMSPNGKLASSCFLENIQLFANPQTEPEKYNLYRGLAAMAEIVEAAHLQLYSIETRLDSIAQEIRKSS